MNAKAPLKKRAQRILYFILFYSGLLHLFLLLFKKLKRNHAAVVLMYHRIIDDRAEDHLYKNPSVHHGVRDFEREMAFLSRWLRVASMDEIARRVHNGRPFPEPCAAVTFDDGYRDNHDLAWPILKRYGLPATIYLTTDLVGTGKRTWFDRIEYALLTTREKTVLLPRLFGDAPIDIADAEGKRRANALISKALKRVDEKEKRALLDALFRSLKVEENGEHLPSRRMLNWDEVRRMSRGGVAFGAHTASHPILTRMPVEEAKREIRSSKRILERETGRGVRHFAFPNGMRDDFSEELKDFCREEGFETIAAAEHGFVDAASDPWFLRRFSANPPLYVFACELMKLFAFPGRFNKGGETYGSRE